MLTVRLVERRLVLAEWLGGVNITSEWLSEVSSTVKVVELSV